MGMSRDCRGTSFLTMDLFEQHIPTLSPLSRCLDELPHSATLRTKNLLNKVGQYCVITPGHFSLVIPTHARAADTASIRALIGALSPNVWLR